MNHYISGIIKIVILEGAIALLLIDRIAGERFVRERQIAFAVISGLMVFAWANFGVLRASVSWPYVLTAIPLVFAVGWLLRAATAESELLTPAQARFRVFTEELGGELGIHKRFTGSHRTIGLTFAVLLSGLWVWWGVQSQALSMVHEWEQFHFYLGAKYQKEVGWFDLYKATLVADQEGPKTLAEVKTTRSIETFDEISVEEALKDGPRVRAKFSDERWAEFKADWATMTSLWRIDWGKIVSDHGNSNSPAWSIIAHPIASMVKLSARSQAALGMLDMVLMLIMWLFVFETFGRKVASIGLLMWATPPIVFDYLSGSFLRWDWLFCLGMAACFIKRERWLTAGAFFGYAVATKLFPIFFGIAMAVQVLFELQKTKVIGRRYYRFLAGAVITGLAAVIISTAMFGADAWAQYAKRIQVAQVEKFYSIQYSLKTVFLQFASSGGSALVQGIYPTEIMQARGDVNIENYTLGFWLVRILFTALIVILIRRATTLEAFLLGPLLVFTWLTVNMYYWNMFGLFAIGLMLRAQRFALAMLIGLIAIFMVFFFYQHFNRGFSEGYAVAFMLSGLILGCALLEWRDQEEAEDGKKLPDPSVESPAT